MSTTTPKAMRNSSRTIYSVAEELGLDPELIIPHGHYIAKILVDELENRRDNPDGKLVLITAMSPTKSGEGKTTTTIGLGDALRKLKKRTAICLREPSLGPYFGIKGGGTGAGASRVVPSEDINLHFVGDMDAVSKANNLLAAMVDNHIYHGNQLNIDPRRITWRRVIDLNDRSLRKIFIGLGGVQHGIPREDGFNITPASEIMAMLCLADNFQDLGKRLARTVIGYTYKGDPIVAADVKAQGALQVLLRDTIHPNLVQTAEGTPAFVHAGPFANIAQGTNSAIATRLALKLADIVVTEAGFGTDLGAEKFMNIKCRIAGLKPSAVVIVATIKALKLHGGLSRDTGYSNLKKHIENILSFGLEPVVAINRFDEDTEQELDLVKSFCKEDGIEAVVTEHFQKGGNGALEIAKSVLKRIEVKTPTDPKFTYPLDIPLEEKIERVAKVIYGADGVNYDRKAYNDLRLLNEHGYAGLPICVAKTPLSFSDDPKLKGRPSGFKITVNELRVSAGAGFVVVICGNIMTMPGLPKEPVAARIVVGQDGSVSGLS